MYQRNSNSCAFCTFKTILSDFRFETQQKTAGKETDGRRMKDTKVQWHPGFVAAMNLELAENRDDLIFVKEHNLNTKPLEIDLLVIKKEPDLFLDNEIGMIFRGHNILEYKSPNDHLDIDTFYKAGAYACLYKSYGETVDSIKADDITVTLVRDAKPSGLLKYFEEHDYRVTNFYKGIYYVEGAVLFPTQIIVTKELEQGTHIWLKSLSDRMEKQDVERLLESIRSLTKKTDRELADSVLEVSVQANEQVIEELIGDDSMSQALMKIMEPKLLLWEKEAIQKGMQEGMQKGIQEGIQKGIQGTVDVLRDLQHGDIEIKTIIKNKYNLSDNEAEEYL